MRICLVHSFYRSASPSGENEVVQAQQRALKAAGHQVGLIRLHSDQLISGPMSAARAALAVASRRGHDPTIEISEFAPDIIHVHNLFPNFGYQWIQPITRRIPVVATLHNFRYVCAKGTLYRDGSSCEDCLTGRLAAVRHGCYRDSMVATLPIVMSQRGGLAKNPIFAHASRIIALTPRSAAIFTRAGAREGQITVIPNGIQPLDADAVRGRRWLYAGRLTEEKGILELLAMWPDDVPLDVAGDGPLRNHAQGRGQSGVRFVGSLPREELRRKLASYRGLVVPSRWAEGGIPLILGEALSVGTPVLALEGSSAADFLADHGGGMVYWDEASLRRSLELWDVVVDRDAARTVFEQNLSEATWIARLTQLYRQVTDSPWGESTSASR